MNFIKRKREKGVKREELQSGFNVSFLALLQQCFLSFLRDANFSSEHSELGAGQLFLRKVIISEGAFFFPKVQLVELCFYFQDGFSLGLREIPVDENR